MLKMYLANKTYCASTNGIAEPGNSFGFSIDDAWPHSGITTSFAPAIPQHKRDLVRSARAATTPTKVVRAKIARAVHLAIPLTLLELPES
jgi:hypothetical protein